jgi:hypothetical protein
MRLRKKEEIKKIDDFIFEMKRHMNFPDTLVRENGLNYLNKEINQLSNTLTFFS